MSYDDPPTIDLGSRVRRPGWVEWGAGLVIGKGARGDTETVWVTWPDDDGRVRELCPDVLVLEASP